MGLTVREKSLIQKVPEQWRNLLTPLLSNTPVKRDHLTSVLAMRYRRQAIHTAESWDMLLMAMGKRVPIVKNDGALCFQSLLWCFPDSFIQEFLKFLLRFHDVISADSLHRFLNNPLPDSCAPSVSHHFRQLSAILAKRCRGCLYGGAADEEGGMMGLPSVDMLIGNGIKGDCDSRPKLLKEDSTGFVVADECGGKSVEVMQGLSGTNSKSSTDRMPVNIPHSSTQNQIFNGSIKASATSDKLSGNSLSRCDLVSDTGDLNDENKSSAAKQTGLTTDAAEDSDSFVVVLDSSDEDDLGVADQKVNMKTVCQKSGKKVSEMGVDSDEEPEVCQEDGQVLQEGGGQEGGEGEGQNSAGQMMVTEANPRDQSRDITDKDAEEDDGGTGPEFLSYMQKLKEALMAGDRGATSANFNFLLSAPASQVSVGFASMEWSSAEEDAVCGLVQGVVGLSERLSHAVSASLVESILRPLYTGIEETLSRQLVSCLSDLAAAFPQQVASVLCDCLQESLCCIAQAEMVTSMCKTWQNDTLLFFLRKLCKADLQLDENLLTVVQCVFGKQPDLSLDLLEAVLHLLETGSAPLARNAKYGRLVLNFVRNYKSQMNSSHVPSLQSIVGLHSSVIRKSLRSAVDALPL